jgi:acetyl-CoA acyltransferase
MATTQDRIAIVDGLRTPFSRAWTTLNGLDPVELSTIVSREILYRNELPMHQVDHIIWGTVLAVPRSPNIAREIALNLGMYRTPGFTVTRACATGLQSIASAAQMIATGGARVVLAGGVDVTSDAPVTYKKDVIDTLQKVQKTKGLKMLTTLAKVNPMDLLPAAPSLSERYTGKTMGQHAEDMAKYFGITRIEQEDFSMASHQKAAKAIKSGKIDPQVVPIFHKGKEVKEDNLVRFNVEEDMPRLRKKKTVFDRKNGTITAFSSSALTDGASCVLIMKESTAKELGLTPMGYVRSYAFPALDPRENMLLGNVYACPEALDRAELKLKDIDIVEIHEAFAAQVLSNVKCFDDAAFFEEKLNRSEKLGELDMDKVNIWGSSIPFGHPFAATGCRMITTALHALKEKDGTFGLATACAAGGLGSAMVVERN